MGSTVKLLMSLLFLVSLSSVYGESSPGKLDSSVRERIECMPAEMIGALLCPLLDQALLIGTVPIAPELIIANLTQFLINILTESNVSSMIEGSLELRNVSIVDLRATNIDACDFGEGKDLKVDLIGTFHNLTLDAVFNVNATITPGIPLTGQGKGRIAMDFMAGILSDVKFCPTDEHMEMMSLNYTLSLPTPFALEIEGLEGDPAVVEEVIKQIIALMDQFRLEIIDLDQQAHENIAKLLLALINSLIFKDLIPCDVLLLQTILGGCDV